jgi:ABC-type nitrate/sulfonate/bicarbonate transport system substrate-binding protein
MRSVTRRSLLALGLTSALAACSDKGRATAEPQVLRYFGSAGQVTMAELAEDLGYLAPLRLEYLGGVLGGPEAIQAVGTRDIEFGNAAIGSVIKLIVAGAPIRQVIASNGVDEQSWSGFFVAEDSPIRTARDLIGKKVAVNTLGAHSEFMLREYLRRGGLSRAQIAQVQMVVIPPLNGEQTLRQKQVDAASMGGVFRDLATQRGGLRLLFSDKSLLGSFNSVDTVFHSQFIAQHPETVRRFVDAVARAIEWARNTPKQTVRARMRAIMERRKRGEDPSLAEHWHSVGINSRGGLLTDADMHRWVDWLVSDGALERGKVKDVSSLYTSEFHPFRDSSRAAL